MGYIVGNTENILEGFLRYFPERSILTIMMSHFDRKKDVAEGKATRSYRIIYIPQ